MTRIVLAFAVVVSLCGRVEAQLPSCWRAQLEWGRPDVEIDHDSTDTSPPAKPGILQILALSHDDDGDRIRIVGTFAPETANIRVTTSSGYSLVTTPEHPLVCSDTHVLREHEHFTVVAYDKAGNASEPFDADVVVAGGVDYRGPCGNGEAYIVIAMVMLTGALLVVLVCIGALRKRSPTGAPEFLSPLLAENVARAVARGYIIKFAVALSTMIGLATFHHPYVAILVGPFALVWLVELLIARYVVGKFDAKIHHLDKRENWIYINSSRLYAPRRIWARASALPSAGLAKRD